MPRVGFCPRRTTMRKHVFPIVGLGLLALVSVTACDRVRSPIGPPPNATPAPIQTVVVRPPATQPSGNPAPPPPGGGSQPGQPVNVNCPAKPADLEPLPRSIVDSAPFGQWFHPIFDQGTFQKSGGFDGQWSWAHTVCLGQSNGGRFKNFERNDGRFVFRMDTTQSHQAFAILTTSRWKSQFMQGDTRFPFSVNIRAMPGTTIQVAGNKSGSQAVSQGGDLTIILPDDGITSFVYDVSDPAMTHETIVWVGPYDRSQNINTFDAR